MSRDGEPGGFHWLLVALAVLFLASAFLGEGPRRGFWVSLAFAAVLLVALYAVASRRQLAVLALGLGVPAAATRVASGLLAADSWLAGPLELLAGVLAALFLGLVAGIILATVLRAGTVTLERVWGAVCVYLLLGLIWAILFGLVEAQSPGSFALATVAGSPAATPGDAAGVAPAGTGDAFVYFSFVTLTTLGFGDITPLSRVARTLTWMEAVTGQLFLAVLIARLVGMTLAPASGRDGVP